MISKSGKLSHEVLYNYILSLVSKVFEKIFLKRLKIFHILIETKKLSSDHQFGFCDEHWTIDQVKS